MLELHDPLELNFHIRHQHGVVTEIRRDRDRQYLQLDFEDYLWFRADYVACQVGAFVRIDWTRRVGQRETVDVRVLIP